MFNARTIGANDPPEAVPIECGRAGSDRMPHRKKRLLILSEIISPYRIPVFNALARHDCVDLRVVFLAETDAGLRQWPVYKGEIRFPYEVLRSWRFRARKHNLLLNWGLRSCLRSFAPEVVICGGYNYFASWDALWWARRHSAELVLWSESNRYDDRRGLAWVELMKAHFLARCDRFVVPGIASFAYLQSLGSAPEHITVAPNAVDNGWFAAKSDIVRVHAQDFREKLDLPPRFVLFAGVWFRRKVCLISSTPMADWESDSGHKQAWYSPGPASQRRNWRSKRSASAREDLFSGIRRSERILPAFMRCGCAGSADAQRPVGLVVNEAWRAGFRSS